MAYYTCKDKSLYTVKMRDKLQEGQLFAYYGGLLNPHRREILRLYYDCDMSLAEIGELTGTTRQAVRDVIVRSVDKLAECEEKLGLVGKVRSIATDLETIVGTGGFTEEQRRLLNEIVEKIKEI